jgi:hypothetical protein
MKNWCSFCGSTGFESVEGGPCRACKPDNRRMWLIDQRGAKVNVKLKQRSEVMGEAAELKAQAEELKNALNMVKAKLKNLCPYPFCSTPERCAGLGCCPKDPCCAD